MLKSSGKWGTSWTVMGKLKNIRGEGLKKATMSSVEWEEELWRRVLDRDRKGARIEGLGAITRPLCL